MSTKKNLAQELLELIGDIKTTNDSTHKKKGRNLKSNAASGSQFEKNGAITEEAIRVMLRERAKNHNDLDCKIPGEVVGLLFEIYQSNDIESILKEIAEDVLTRYAKIQVIEQKAARNRLEQPSSNRIDKQ